MRQSGSDRYDYRFCGGTVVPSPGENLFASAAHCFDSDDQKENLVFVPQHSAANPMPHGLFPIKKGSIFKDPGYTGTKKSEQDYTDVDVAFLATESRGDGKKAEEVVGAIPMASTQAFTTPSRPSDTPTCTAVATTSGSSTRSAAPHR